MALAFVDRFTPSAATYFTRKQEIASTLSDALSRESQTLDRVTVDINTLDDPARGEAVTYSPSSALQLEGGDCGQVGRRNKVSGIISFNRPAGSEAAAGKNPVSHVGKIYTLLTHQLAAEIHASVPAFAKSMSAPVNQPAIASAQLILEAGCALANVSDFVKAVIERGLANMSRFTDQLIRGDWPLS